jgi:N-acetylglucosamine kinase-like BadF-type ATPase
MSGLTVGIDIGGTKTHLRAYDHQNSVRDLILPSAQWRARDWDADARALVGLAQELADGGTIDTMAVGAHGCDNQAECDAFEAAFARQAVYPVKVVNDSELLPAALSKTVGIGVVSGTGSIAVTRNSDGRMLVAGGWGWVIGDEGSASGLVREAGRAAAYHIDTGGSESEPLIQLLFATLGIDNSARIGSAIAGSGSAAVLGQHAKAVFQAAEMGSALAQRVIREGAGALVELVARLKQVGAEATSAVAGGGVIVAQPMLANAFLEQMQKRFNGEISAEIYAGPPVEGACYIAKTMRGRFQTGQGTAPMSKIA